MAERSEKNDSFVHLNMLAWKVIRLHLSAFGKDLVGIVNLSGDSAVATGLLFTHVIVCRISRWYFALKFIVQSIFPYVLPNTIYFVNIFIDWVSLRNFENQNATNDVRYLINHGGFLLKFL